MVRGSWIAEVRTDKVVEDNARPHRRVPLPDDGHAAKEIREKVETVITLNEYLC